MNQNGLSNYLVFGITVVVVIVVGIGGYFVLRKEPLERIKEGRQIQEKITAEGRVEPLALVENQSIDLNLINTKLALLPEAYKNTSDFAFSQDGRRVAYKVDLYPKNEEFIIINNQEDKHFNSVKTPFFSPSGVHIAYKALLNEKQLIVLDGKEGKLYDNVNGPYFSPDNEEIVYVATEMKKDENNKFTTKSFVVINGIEGKHYNVEDVNEGIGNSVFFSPNGKKVAYTVRGDGEEFLVINDREGKRYKEISPRTTPYIVFSQDGETVAYVASDGQKEFVVKNEQEYKKYEYVDPFIAISPDGQRLAYTVRAGEKEFAVIDGKIGKLYDNVSDFTFNVAGNHIIYNAYSGKNNFIILDDQEIKLEDHSVEKRLFFSPIDGRMAYAARQGYSKKISKDIEEFYIFNSVFVDGKQGKQYRWVSYPVWYPDGNGVAYLAWDGEKYFLVTGEREKEIGKYDSVGITRLTSPHVFSDLPHLIVNYNGEYVAFGARAGRNLLWVVESVK